MNNNAGVVSEEVNRVSPVVPTYPREIANIFGIGLVAGLIAVVSYYLLNTFIFSAVLCREGAAANCADAPTYATVVAIVLSSIVGLVALVQVRVYRPLLIVLATAVTLWGLAGLVDDLAWYFAGLIAVGFFGFSYLLYGWIARIRSFVIALIVTATLLVAARVILLS